LIYALKKILSDSKFIDRMLFILKPQFLIIGVFLFDH